MILKPSTGSSFISHKAKPPQNGTCDQVKNYSASDGDKKMKNKLRKDKNRGSKVRIVEAMLENASQHA